MKFDFQPRFTSKYVPETPPLRQLLVSREPYIRCKDGQREKELCMVEIKCSISNEQCGTFLHCSLLNVGGSISS